MGHQLEVEEEEPQQRRTPLSRWQRRFRRLGQVAALLLVVKGIWFYQCSMSGDALLSGASRTDLLERRAYLLERVATDSFGPADMPSVFHSPFKEELAISTLSMTTLALTNLAFRFPETREETLFAMDRMLQRMLSPEIRRFEILWWGQDALDSLEKPQGQIGYLGHLNLMLGCWFMLGGDKKYNDLFERVTAALVRRMEEGPGYQAETFPGATIVADNLTVALSIRLYDWTHGPRYERTLRKWYHHLREHLRDPKTGMIRYQVDEQGHALGSARGVLQAWMSMLMPNIESTYGKDHYETMRRLLLDEKLGYFGGVREFPKGETGQTNIISGPIIWGVSTAATAFAIGGAAAWKDAETLTGLLRTAEFVGCTISISGKRRYLFAPLVGDAIMLAAMTTRRFDDRFLRDIENPSPQEKPEDVMKETYEKEKPRTGPRE